MKDDDLADGTANPEDMRSQYKLSKTVDQTIASLKANGFQYATAGDSRRLIEEIERLRCHCADLIAQGMEKAADCQPSTAENPNESAYERGRFDGIMDFGRAIRASAATLRQGEKG